MFDSKKIINDLAREIAALPNKPTEEQVRRILTDGMFRAGLEIIADDPSLAQGSA